MDLEKIFAGVIIILALCVVIFGSIYLFTKPVYDTQKMINDKLHPGPGENLSHNNNTAIFFEEASVNPENVEFRLAPAENMTGYYSVLYNVDLEISEDFSGDTGSVLLSPENPFVLNITKKEGEWVDIFISIKDQNQTVVWNSDRGYT